MSAEIIHVSPDAEPDAPSKADRLIQAAEAANTKLAYNSDWADFARWCASRDLDELPAAPETVEKYLEGLAGALKASTISRRITTIRLMHRSAGAPCPINERVRKVWRGIRRTYGVARSPKAPVLTDDLRRMIDALPAGTIGVRDRALLLLGFAGAFRRSELAGLDVADVERSREGLTVTLRRSKTDQEGEGRRIGIPYGSNPETCPVRAFKAWLAVRGEGDGPIFRRIHRSGRIMADRIAPRVVALIVKRYAEAAGIDPAGVSGHSLRSGFCTSAAARGASERSMMEQTGHRSPAMLRGYIRDANLFADNAASKLGL